MRRALTLSVVLASTLALTGCVGLPFLGGSDDGPAGKLSSAGSEVEYRADPDVVGTTVMAVSGDFSDVPESLDNRVVAPGIDLRITKVATFASLGADVFEDVTGEEPTDDEGEPVEEVHAAAGQVFLAAQYASDDPHWRSAERMPESVAAISLAGNDISELFSTSDGTLQRGTVVVSVPEDIAPESAAIAVTTDEKRQALSLVNGARIGSDVPATYRVVASEAAVTSADTIDETFEGWTGHTEYLSGGVESAFVTTWLDRDAGIDGWSGRGRVFLSVSVDWRKQSSSSNRDESAMYVELADGTTVRPMNEPRTSSREAFGVDPVFEIPADTEKATVVIEPKVKVGSSDETSWDPLKAAVTITTKEL